MSQIRKQNGEYFVPLKTRAEIADMYKVMLWQVREDVDHFLIINSHVCKRCYKVNTSCGDNVCVTQIIAAQGDSPLSWNEIGEVTESFDKNGRACYVRNKN